MREELFLQIYKGYSRRVYNFVLWMTRSRAAADDIVQTTFIKLWKLPEFPEKSNEREAWLFTVAKNACMDHFRSHRRLSQLRSDFTESTPSHAVNGAEQREAWELLDDLSPEERSVVYLHIKMGYNYKEIGALIGLAENAVRVKAFRAFKRLREKHADSAK